MKYTRQQTDIINSHHRRILVNSVAGSGKTTTIKGIIKKAIASGIRPDDILICTFTRKMANELREKNSRISWCDTIHGIAFRILESRKDLIGYNNMILVDDVEDKELIKKVISRNYLKVTIKRAEEIIRDYCHAGTIPIEKKQENIFIKVYIRELRDRDFITYGLLEYYANIVLDKCPEIGFKLVVVDEYQDTSTVEASIVRRLAKDRLIVVGDVMQSIYGFRGAVIGNMLNMDADSVYEMSTSFRIPEAIAPLANHLISMNNFGYRLAITPGRSGGALRIVDGIHRESLYEELDILLALYHPEDIYILSRTNRQIDYLIEILAEYPIDKEMAAVKNMKYLSYLDIACAAYYNGFHNYALTRLLRLFDYRDAELIKWENEGGSIYEKVRNDIPLKEFNAIMGRDIPFNEKAECLLPMFEKRRMEYDTAMNKVIPYLEGISSAIDYMEWYKNMSVADFMPKDKIALITVHASKGMESKAVLLPYIKDGDFPNARAQFQEELRLFYVAVTRAMETLVILNDNSIFLRGYNEKTYNTNR